MKTAILSDIHSNLEALEAVLRDIDQKGGVDQYWCLGDTVDYGPDPHQCLERIRQLNALCIIGNHDAAVSGKLDFLKEFPDKFITVTRWTQEKLTAEDQAYLSSLPTRIETGNFTLVHGSPRDPVYEYILSREAAQQNLFYFKTAYCLVGHTHLPSKFDFKPDEKPTAPVPFEKPKPPPKDEEPNKERSPFASYAQHPESLIELREELLIINPGAVGQQRDKDPRAAYALYNDLDSTVELRRVEYDVNISRQKILASGLPAWLGDNLAAGK
jgi:diadenosine tetraphosphatase ApaH/serine/threonine PP2A family protein phosphatase